MRLFSLIAVGLSIGLLGGCSCDDRPPPSRLVPQRGAVTVAIDAGSPTRRPRTPPSIGGGDRRARPAAEVEPDAGPERDLDAELNRSFGDPTSCLTWGDDAPESVSVDISVTITESGMVTRSTARGSWVDHVARRCLERRANSVRFASPVPGAPANASTSFTIRNRRPAKAPPAPTLDQYTDGDVVVLEAVPGRPIQGPAGDPIRGPAGEEISGPAGDSIDGPAGVPIEANPGIPIGQE